MVKDGRGASRVFPLGKRWRLSHFGREAFFGGPKKVGGGAGIRTLGRLPYADFQDQCFRPLSHPSKGERILYVRG